MEENKLKNIILEKWRRVKKLNEDSKNPEVSKKLNRFLITKDIKEKTDILDEAIAILEKEKEVVTDSKINEFKNILSNESFFKQEGKAQVINVEIDNKDTDKTIYERLGIAENDDMKNYQIFEKLIKEYKEQQAEKGGFHSIKGVLDYAKYFEVPDKINWMLLNTKNKVSEIKLPYIYMFFDTKFIIEDRTYYGLLLGDISQLKEIAEKSKEVRYEDLKNLGEGIIIQTFYEGDKKVGWTKFRLHEKTRDRKINKLKEYIMNLVYFINSEDVKIMVHVRSEKNTQRRIQNNRIPIPTYNKLQIHGYLAKYLEKVESEGIGRGFNYRFTVRGHWRHFWDKKFDNLYKLYNEGKLKEIEGKQYTMDNSGALKVWIFPYIKGQGILIDKKYELK